MIPSQIDERFSYDERRRWPRCQCDIPVRVVLHRYDHTVLIEGCGNGLNEGGLRIFAGMQLPVGRDVEVEFTLPDSEQPRRVPGTIRNRERYLYGVEFTIQNADQRQWLAQLQAHLQETLLPS
jgi:hypothetical protein